MTEIEAKKEIEHNVFCNTDNYEMTISKECYKTIINALEKQVPKEPTPIDYEKYMDIVKNALFLKGAYWCPNCKHVVKCGTYCSDCGQKLDWDE